MFTEGLNIPIIAYHLKKKQKLCVLELSRFCEKWTWGKQLKNHFHRPIVLVCAISHKFKQNELQNVDSVHFSQNTNISDSTPFPKTSVEWYSVYSTNTDNAMLARI